MPHASCEEAGAALGLVKGSVVMLLGVCHLAYCTGHTPRYITTPILGALLRLPAHLAEHNAPTCALPWHCRGVARLVPVLVRTAIKVTRTLAIEALYSLGFRGTVDPISICWLNSSLGLEAALSHRYRLAKEEQVDGQLCFMCGHSITIGRSQLL